MNTLQIQNSNISQQHFIMNIKEQSENDISQPSGPIDRPSENLKSYELSRKTTQQLIKIIQGKDEQIHQLTETLQKIRRQDLLKTKQAQLSQFNVVQEKWSYNCLWKKFELSRQKIGLLKQINERLFKENLQMEQNVAKVNKQIIEIKEQMKAQDSTNSIKLAQIKAELNQQRKKNKQHVKQISMLKAIIKELQQELQQEDQDQDGDYGEGYCCENGETSTKTTEFEELNIDENGIVFQSSFNQSHHHQPRQSHSLPNSVQLKKIQHDQEPQQSDIIFAQA